MSAVVTGGCLCGAVRYEARGPFPGEGISTDGADLYVTDFPCPYCARIIAKSGVGRLYFLRGYAVLEGDDFLTDAGIEVYRISCE